MSKGAKTAVLVVAVIALIGAAFWGGTYYSRATRSARFGAMGGPGGNGGPMGNISDAERQKIANMSDTERQQFFAERMRSEGASGMPGPRGNRSPQMEGSIVSVSGETFTLKLANGGSASVYLKDDTTIAYAKGVEAKELATGDEVIVLATPAADNVINATLVVVK